MPIDWESEIEALEKSDIADHMFKEGAPPITGSDSPHGYFLDRAISEAGSAACSLQSWIIDNSPFEMILDFRFEAWNSKAKITILWKDLLDENGQKVVAKMWDWQVVTGRSSQTSNFAGQHELLGALMFKKFCEWILNLKENTP